MDRDQTSWILRLIAAVAVVVLLTSALAAHSLAAEWRGHGEGRWHGREVPHWGHGDIARFHERDLDRWHGGHWFHGKHFGRLGWWWVVGGAWYFYPAPVCPYPDPYVPPSGRDAGTASTAHAVHIAVLVLLPERERVLSVCRGVSGRLEAGGPSDAARMKEVWKWPL